MRLTAPIIIGRIQVRCRILLSTVLTVVAVILSCQVSEALVKVSISGSGLATRGTPNRSFTGNHDVVVAKNASAASDDIPSVTISATDSTATEAGATTGQFTLTRSGSADSPLIVRYLVGGYATPDTDYLALSGSVTMPAGASSGTITVEPLNDAEIEIDETVVVTLSANTAYTIGASSRATVTIASDEFPTPKTGATYVSCVRCHALPYNQAVGELGRHGSASREAVSPDEICQKCHNTTGHADNPEQPPSQPHFMKLPVDSTSFTGPPVGMQICLGCHQNEATAERGELLGGSTVYYFNIVGYAQGHPMKQGPISGLSGGPYLRYESWSGNRIDRGTSGAWVTCSTCHDIHEEVPFNLRAGGIVIMPTADKPREFTIDAAPGCSECHPY